MRPPCFSSDEQLETYEALLEKTESDARATFCWDCTREFQDEMKEEGRCQHPEVKFVVVTSSSGPSLQGLRRL